MVKVEPVTRWLRLAARPRPSAALGPFGHRSDLDAGPAARRPGAGRAVMDVGRGLYLTLIWRRAGEGVPASPASPASPALPCPARGRGAAARAHEARPRAPRAARFPQSWSGQPGPGPASPASAPPRYAGYAGYARYAAAFRHDSSTTRSCRTRGGAESASWSCLDYGWPCRCISRRSARNLFWSRKGE